MDQTVHLVETTLRDGSYEIDFQFTAEDTALLCAAFDAAGVKYIEVCPGNGVGAAAWDAKWRPKRSGGTDEELLAAAQATCQRAKFGVLMVVGPEFTPVSYFDVLAKYHTHFVRVALRPDVFLRREQWLPWVDRGKELGMLVSINLMQAPSFSHAQVAAGVKDAAAHGCDWFYIVDSAGGLTPPQTEGYIRAITDAADIVAGLHAHNNSGLAVANSLAAVAAGAGVVDGTLQGIGRATGNAPTEQLLLGLQRLGHELDVDREVIMNLGEASRALFAERGNSPTHFVSGAAGIHSRGVATMWKVAEERGLAPREFLLEMGAEMERRKMVVRDMSLSAELFDLAAAKTPKAKRPEPTAKMVEYLAQQIERASRIDPPSLVEDLSVRSFKHRKTSVLHLVDASDYPFASALPWETADLIGVTAPVDADADWSRTPKDRAPDVVLLDDRIAARADLPSPRLHRLRHSFRALVADATADLVLGSLGKRAAQVTMAGDVGPLAARVRQQLAERGVEVVATAAAGTARILLAPPQRGPWLDGLAAGDVVILLGHGPDARAIADHARAASATVLRPLLGPAAAARAGELFALQTRLAQPLDGEGAVVDPLVAPAAGQTVVDSTTMPSRVLDGEGASVSGALAATRAATLLRGAGSL